MRQDPEHKGNIVEGEIAKPKTKDDQVMGQPTKAEENSHNNDHPSDFAFTFLRIRHDFHGIHRCPEIADGP